MPLPLSPLVGLPEVCVALRLPYPRVYGLLLRGVIPAERRGSRWFVRREDLDRLVRVSTLTTSARTADAVA